MKRIISILLLSVILYYSFFQIGTFFNYVKDIKGYTEQFCVNKDKPTLHCNGKCHLVKELAQQEKQKENKDLQIMPEINLFVEDSPIELFSNPNINEVIKHTYFYKSFFSNENVDATYPPPRQLI
ncbi:MAG: hypothetical protein H3C31_12280 [Brumimicrobium sp.]|nr:hypothetical protein [Brumimicrobium sp.]